MARRSFLLARTGISSAILFSLMGLHPWFGFASSLTAIYSRDTYFYTYTHSLQPDALPTAATARAGEDIVDPKAYSFEQAKQRMELDRRMRTAEEKKMDDRRAVRTLRKQFEQILAEVSNCLWGGCLWSYQVFMLHVSLTWQNATLPPSLQLPADALEMDPAMRGAIEEQTAAELERVQAELAWALEKQTVAHEKLRAHFIDGLDSTRYVVKAFRTPDQVVMVLIQLLWRFSPYPISDISAFIIFCLLLTS